MIGNVGLLQRFVSSWYTRTWLLGKKDFQNVGVLQRNTTACQALVCVRRLPLFHLWHAVCSESKTFPTRGNVPPHCVLPLHALVVLCLHLCALADEWRISIPYWQCKRTRAARDGEQSRHSVRKIVLAEASRVDLCLGFYFKRILPTERTFRVGSFSSHGTA